MNADQLDRFAIRERIKNWVAWREAQDWSPFEILGHDYGGKALVVYRVTRR